MSGSSSGGNSTSTTGPMIWMTLPVATTLSLPVRRRHELRRRGDLQHLAGDLGLARLVEDQRQILDQVLRVLVRVAHRDHLGAEEARAKLQDRLVDQHLDVTRQELLQDRARVRLEDVVDRLLDLLAALDRQDL